MSRLPVPRLTPVYRLEAVLGDPLDLGEVSEGHRRIVPLIDGTFEGPDVKGKLQPGASARHPATAAVGTPMVLAVGGPTSREVSALATPLARARGAAVHVLHVSETDVLAGEDTADLESPTDARALLDACIAELREAGVPVTGELLHSYDTHADVAAAILHRATDLGAGAIVLGPETRHAATSGVNAYIATHAPGHVIILNPDAGVLGRPSVDALRNGSQGTTAEATV